MTDEPNLPHGKYAIVELMGHSILVGRVNEVERFGVKMLAIEPLFNGELLDPCLHGGAAIYRFTVCSAKVAWEKQPRKVWQLPAALQAIVPERLLPTHPDSHILTHTVPDDDYDEDET